MYSFLVFRIYLYVLVGLSVSKPLQKIVLDDIVFEAHMKIFEPPF